MIVDFQVAGSWMNLNDKVGDLLKIDRSKYGVKVYPSSSAALLEKACVLMQVYPTKKKMVYTKDFDPTIQPVVAMCSRMGFQCVGIPHAELNNADQLKSIFSKDTLFFLNSYDDPILGRTLPLDAAFAISAEVGVMCLSVSHSHHTQNSSLVLPGRLQTIVSSTPVGLSIAISGERFRIGSLIVEQMQLERFYSKEQVEMAASSLVSNRDRDQGDLEAKRRRVVEFETNKDLKFSFHLEAQQVHGLARLYDRAVVSWHDLDGHAVISRLAKKVGVGLMNPGMDSMMETTSLSRWGGIKSMDWLHHQGFSKETIRGMMIFSCDLLSDTFVEHLRQVRESILSDQG
jgi:hypothetical protein